MILGFVLLFIVSIILIALISFGIVSPLVETWFAIFTEQNEEDNRSDKGEEIEYFPPPAFANVEQSAYGDRETKERDRYRIDLSHARITSKNPSAPRPKAGHCDREQKNGQCPIPIFRSASTPTEVQTVV